MGSGLQGFARRLRSRLGGLSRREPDSRTGIPDPWEIRGEPTPEPPARILLDEIQATALSVYKTHGLPTRVGQYARSARGKVWKFVAEELDAEERWELFLANDSGKGWRFASLEDLGLMESSGSPDLRKAAMLLTACRVLQASLTGRGSSSRADDIETAIRLGSEWRMIELGLTRTREGPLRLGKARRGRRAPAPAGPDLSPPVRPDLT